MGKLAAEILDGPTQLATPTKTELGSEEAIFWISSLAHFRVSSVNEQDASWRLVSGLADVTAAVVRKETNGTATRIL